MCEGEPTTCCVAPNKANLIFAGTSDGGISVWDLQEPSSFHLTIDVEKETEWKNIETLTIRRPSYRTDGLYRFDKSHRSSIQEILPLFKYQDKNSGLDISDESMSFQIASIDDVGYVQLWVRRVSKACLVSHHKCY